MILIIAVSVVVLGVVWNPTQDGVTKGATLNPDTVVARVQSGQTYPDDLRRLLQATRASPGDLTTAKAAARATINAGRDAGDSRMVGASLGILRPFLTTPDSETLYLAATARQYQHDFPGALHLLDQALSLAPDDVNARLSRATIQTVEGRFAAAEADCRALNAAPGVAFLCQSTALLMTAQAPAIEQRLTLILQQPGLMDPSLTPWALGLLGELAQLNIDHPKARDYFQQVLALDPKSIRDRLILADLMLQDGLADQVAPLLKDAPPTDGVLIRRVLAAMALKADSAADRAELAKRFQLNLDLGLTAHAREEARYFLEIAKDPVLALQRAQVNWAMQHEFEDAGLLIDAAIAASQPAAAQPVLDWATEQNVTAPALHLDDLKKRLAP
ncbi:MAG: hypothetical protein H7245_00450 [Candidatus Saccharibacteria bacterium]|nr:hypothetical protein [Pseudorhodobacter sp.]